jgi:hypothetical protein
MKPAAENDSTAMSDNYRFYAEKMKKRRAAATASSQRLDDQLQELLAVVRRREAIWALEDRIEHGFGGGGKS